MRVRGKLGRMDLRIRFIGRARATLERRGITEEAYPVQVSPELIHIHDGLRHPLFPGQSLHVVGRQVDLIANAVTVDVDLVPTESHESPFPPTLDLIDD